MTKIDPLVEAMLNARIRERSQYYTNLGLFVDYFAALEGVLTVTLWYHAGLQQPLAQCILSGVCSDTAREFITRIHAAFPVPTTTKDNYKAAFQQIGVITKARNDLLHFGTPRGESGGEERHVENWSQAHIEERRRQIRMTPNDLLALAGDTQTLTSLLGGWLAFQMHNPNAPLPAWQPPSWLYKPQPQAPRRDTSPETPPASPPLLPPSLE